MCSIALITIEEALKTNSFLTGTYTYPWRTSGEILLGRLNSKPQHHILINNHGHHHKSFLSALVAFKNPIFPGTD